MDNIWYFEDINLFKILCPTKFGEYKKSNTIKLYQKGEFIYFTDDPANNIFLISNGKVKILNYTEGGEEVVKSILSKGDIFGELVVLGEEKRSDFAQVLEKDTYVCQMNLELLEGLMLENKTFALSIHKLIGLRIKKLERRLDSLVFKDVRTRLEEFIVDLVETSDAKPGGVIKVPHFYTHKDMADLIGTSRQTVTTTLNELKNEGLLDFNRKEFLVTEDLIRTVK